MWLTVIRHQPQKSEVNPILMVGRNKGALALPSDQEIFIGQLINGLANCALADLETPGQFDFTGNRCAGFPLTGLQTLQNQDLDLLVQGTE